MTHVSSSNAPHSDTALLTGPPKRRQYPTQDERMFLAQQAADAQTAMRRAVADMKATATEAANVRWWTRQYPWYAVGAAAVLGFVTATQVLAPSEHRAQPVQGQAAPRPSWLSSLFEVVRSAVLSAILGALHPSGQPSEQSQAGVDQASMD